MANTATCYFKADDNTYGLGIRLGLYLQWTSTILAFLILPEEVINMISVNRSFTISTFIALLYTTLSHPLEEINAFDPTILAYLCYFSIVFTQISFLHPEVRAGLRGALLNFCLLYAVCGYEVWFSFSGLHKMQPVCFKDAHDGLVKLGGQVINARKAISVIILFAVGLHLLGCIWIFFSVSRKRNVPLRYLFAPNESAGKEDGSPNVTDSPGVYQQPSSLAEKLKPWLLGTVSSSNIGGIPPASAHVLFYAAATISIIALVAFIPFIEVLIRRNHAQGVTSLGSTGQLIPLVVGGTGFMDVSLKVFWKWFGKRRRLSLSDVSGKDEAIIGFETMPFCEGDPIKKPSPGHVPVKTSEDDLVDIGDERNIWSRNSNGYSYLPSKDRDTWIGPPPFGQR